jgi:hypothetical protein
VIRAYETAQARVREAVLDTLAKPTGVAVVKAPPGSGKTLLLCELVARLLPSARIAVATQTRSQANDLCARLARDGHRPVRFAKEGDSFPGLPATVSIVTSSKELPRGGAVVVATTKKWAAVTVNAPFDVLLVDEAWQMPWSAFMPLSRVAGRFVLVGDPGQIPPTVTVDTSRWETSPFAPHRPTPEVVQTTGAPSLVAELPASRRLPHDTVELIQPFYDFAFGAWARPEDRGITMKRRGRTKLDAALDHLTGGSLMALTLPTADYIPEVDDELVALTVDAIASLLARGTHVQMTDQPDGPSRRLVAAHVGVSSTHRSTNEALARRLASTGLGDVKVDTPERWQGLQCDMMFALHPLSGVLMPSAFDLETGRLCVMASRHRGGLVIVSRDHVGDTLEETLPVADQAVGREDTSGRGLEQHLRLWRALMTAGRIVPA